MLDSQAVFFRFVNVQQQYFVFVKIEVYRIEQKHSQEGQGSAAANTQAKYRPVTVVLQHLNCELKTLNICKAE